MRHISAQPRITYKCSHPSHVHTLIYPFSQQAIPIIVHSPFNSHSSRTQTQLMPSGLFRPPNLPYANPQTSIITKSKHKRKNHIRRLQTQFRFPLNIYTVLFPTILYSDGKRRTARRNPVVGKKTKSSKPLYRSTPNFYIYERTGFLPPSVPECGIIFSQDHDHDRSRPGHYRYYLSGMPESY